MPHACDYREGFTMVRAVFLGLLIALLTACSSVSTRFVTGLTAEQRAAAAALPVYDTLPAGLRYQPVGEVEGLSCQTRSKEAFRASEAGAMEELRRAAVRDGGNALTGVSCTSLNRGQQGSNCFRAFQCRGLAISVESGSVPSSD
jgi:uncharacterized protein YbjQ (UPF0145 family)